MRKSDEDNFLSACGFHLTFDAAKEIFFKRETKCQKYWRLARELNDVLCEKAEVLPLDGETAEFLKKMVEYLHDEAQPEIAKLERKKKMARNLHQETKISPEKAKMIKKIITLQRDKVLFS